MNERIKELYKEAYGVRMSLDDFALDANERKFAELLIKECFLQCDISEAGKSGFSKEFNDGHIMGVSKCYYKIKNHFGIL